MNKIFLLFCVGILFVTIIFALSVSLNSQRINTNIITSGDNSEVVGSSGLEVFYPKPGDVILSPLKITGVVKGDGWTGFEGQVGTVRLQDLNGKELASTYLAATTEWTQLPTRFEANFIFNKGNATSGRLIFHNENPSGDPERDKTMIIPVTFK